LIVSSFAPRRTVLEDEQFSLSPFAERKVHNKE
jgi:hypothetical protein